MSERDDGGPAFPNIAVNMVYSNGMTLRDWFAGQALAGMNANPEWDVYRWDDRAEQAFLAADAMLEARK